MEKITFASADSQENEEFFASYGKRTDFKDKKFIIPILEYVKQLSD